MAKYKTVEIIQTFDCAIIRLIVRNSSGSGDVSYYISREEAQDLMDDLADCLSQPLMPAPLIHSTIPDG